MSVRNLSVCSCIHSLGWVLLTCCKDRSNHSSDLQECFGPESLIWDERLNNSQMCMKWHYSSLSSFNLLKLIPPLCQNPKMTFKLTCRLSNYTRKLYHILLSSLSNKLQTEHLRNNNASAFAFSCSSHSSLCLSVFRRRSLTALSSLWSPSKELACLISGADPSLLCSVQL